jgi:hypothetical protein
MKIPMVELVAWTVWIIRVKGLASDNDDVGYNLEVYKESPGIYYENRGQASFYTTNWKTVVYVDLKHTINQSIVIEQYVRHINRLCQELTVKTWTECNYFHDIAENKIRQIKGTERLLLEITDPKYSRKRVRRGVFNFIGEVSKILFGTMDNEDAEYYNGQIRHFEENADSMTNLMKQQLSVVKSTLGAINETLSDMEYNESVVRSGLRQIKIYMDSVMSNTTSATRALDAKITVEGHIARVYEALNNLQRSLDITIDSILNARKGILQPQVVAPHHLMEVLTRSIPSFPKDTTTPFPLSEDSMNLLHRICDLHVYLKDGILGYVVELPLVNRGNFKIFKMIPIPVTLKPSTFLYIETVGSILCLDQARQFSLMLTEDELRQCKRKDSYSYVCKQNQPLLSSHSQESCAVKLLQSNDKIPKSCETRIVKLSNTVWVQLLNNEWIYFSPTVDSVTVLCGEKEPIDVTLKGVGKLHMNSGCKGYSSTALLQTSFTVTNNVSMKGGDLLTQIPLQIECCEDLNEKVNLSSIHLDMKFKHIVSHLDDLKYASFKVSDLEKEVKEQEWKNKHLSSHVSYSVMVYIVLVLISLYALYKLYKYVRGWWTGSGGLKALTAPILEARASTGPGGLGNTVNINIKTSNDSLVADSEAIPLRDSVQSLKEETPTRRSLRPRLTKSYF